MKLYGKKDKCKYQNIGSKEMVYDQQPKPNHLVKHRLQSHLHKSIKHNFQESLEVKRIDRRTYPR
jgi:hypothetical protein